MEIPEFMKDVIHIRVPSGQWWNARTEAQRQEWRDLITSLGGNPEDYLNKMRSMLPKNPKGK